MALRVAQSEKAKIPNFTELNNLERDGKILFATDDWFAVAENLLKRSDPEWKEGVFDDCGKWMDGWETRRKRIAGHDWCIIKLGFPGIIHGVDVDTSYFTGNHTPKVSIQAACLTSVEEHLVPPREKGNGTAASESEFSFISQLRSEEWTTIVDRSVLGAGYADTCHNYLEVSSREQWTHLRLNMFPDGGIARLRVYGTVKKDAEDIFNEDADEDGFVDLVAMENGGVCIGHSNAHYGHPRNAILKSHPVNMEDGWETARRLDRPEILAVDDKGVLQFNGCEWAVYRLGLPGVIYRIEIATTRFIGNYPESCKVQGCLLEESQNEEDILQQDEELWHTVLSPKKLGPNQNSVFPVISLERAGEVSHVRVLMIPDGGISRIRIWGRPSALPYY